MSDDIQCSSEHCTTPLRCVGIGCCRLTDSAPATTMRPATGTLRIPAIDPRQALAAFLLARHEARVAEGMTPQLLQWGEMQILAGSNAPHSGDCSNENSSCPRCAYEAALRDAGAILALISGSNVTIDPEAATAPELRKLRKLVDGRR